MFSDGSEQDDCAKVNPAALGFVAGDIGTIVGQVMMNILPEHRLSQALAYLRRRSTYGKCSILAGNMDPEPSQKLQLLLLRLLRKIVLVGGWQQKQGRRQPALHRSIIIYHWKVRKQGRIEIRARRCERKR